MGRPVSLQRRRRLGLNPQGNFLYRSLKEGRRAVARIGPDAGSRSGLQRVDLCGSVRMRELRVSANMEAETALLLAGGGAMEL
jgi:hypothetical protein